MQRDIVIAFADDMREIKQALIIVGQATAGAAAQARWQRIGQFDGIAVQVGKLVVGAEIPVAPIRFQNDSRDAVGVLCRRPGELTKNTVFGVSYTGQFTAHAPTDVVPRLFRACGYRQQWGQQCGQQRESAMNHACPIRPGPARCRRLFSHPAS